MCKRSVFFFLFCSFIAVYVGDAVFLTICTHIYEHIYTPKHTYTYPYIHTHPLSLSLSLSLSLTHTHTHTYIYMYIYGFRPIYPCRFV